MIDHQRKLIFVHLRRTAGNSIEVALGGITLLGRDGEPTLDWDNALHRGKTPFKIDNRGHYIHDTATAIRNQFPEEFSSYKKFTIVRNPWDQLVSLYLRLSPHDHHAVNFKPWLFSLKRPAHGTLPFCSLFDTRGSLLVDYIGKYENIADDFSRICDACGIENLALPETNKSFKRHYRDYYDPASREFVRKLCDAEINEFGYSF